MISLHIPGVPTARQEIQRCMRCNRVMTRMPDGMTWPVFTWTALDDATGRWQPAKHNLNGELIGAKCAEITLDPGKPLDLAVLCSIEIHEAQRALDETKADHAREVEASLGIKLKFLTGSELERMARIDERISYLAKEISEKPRPAGRDYRQQELSALRWAVGKIRSLECRA